MSEPSAHIELASKPQHPEVDTLSDRRRRAVARWHAFAMYEEARVWREDQEAERARQRSTEQQDSQESQDAQGDKTVSPRKSCDSQEYGVSGVDTEQGTIDDDQQELMSSDKTKSVESHDEERMSYDGECRHGSAGSAESDSPAIRDDENPEKKQAVFARAESNRNHLHTPDFTLVYAKKVEMPIINHSASAGSHEDEGAMVPQTPAREAKAEKKNGDVNHLDEKERKERSMMWE
ncbi:hypothetical protein LTR29_009816 [Friedmanniomyces endolithicus]|nr:hypothetical protein LTR29_009816 [Friedmanniomyces endolithicus]